MEKSAFNVINTCTNSNLKIDNNTDVVDMCQAILDMKDEAENNGKLEVALNLIKLGKISLKEVSDVTGLSLDEIKSLSLTN